MVRGNDCTSRQTFLKPLLSFGGTLHHAKAFITNIFYSMLALDGY
jgi:hypothetical protein